MLLDFVSEKENNFEKKLKTNYQFIDTYKATKIKTIVLWKKELNIQLYNFDDIINSITDVQQEIKTHGIINFDILIVEENLEHHFVDSSNIEY